MKKVLLTGATGFLGSNLINALVKNNKYQITILKRSFSDTFRIKNIMDQIKFYDIDKCELELPFKDSNGFDIIIHTSTTYGRKDASITEIVESNVVFPLQLMEIASSYNVETVFINTDTFFNNEESTNQYSYLSSYTCTKKQILDWGKIFAKESLLKFINIKLFQIYGYNDGKNKFTTFVFDSLSNSVDELKLTLGEQKRDFIYIDDVVSAYLQVVEQIGKGKNNFQEFELGCGSSISIKSFVENTAKIFGSKTELKFGALQYRENEIMDSIANLKNLKELGWFPKYSLNEGLNSIIDKIRYDKTI